VGVQSLFGVKQASDMKLAVLVASALLCTPSLSTDAFAPRSGVPFQRKTGHLMSTLLEAPTKPIEGMKPGTSGLRKKVEVWQGVDEINKHYVENFIQSLLDTAQANNGGKMLDT
jgi:phosphoglucomutase